MVGTKFARISAIFIGNYNTIMKWNSTCLGVIRALILILVLVFYIVVRFDVGPAYRMNCGSGEHLPTSRICCILK